MNKETPNFLCKIMILLMGVKIGVYLYITPPQSRFTRQLPLKGGAQYSLPPGGEGVTVGDGRGDCIIPINYNLTKTTESKWLRCDNELCYFALILMIL